MSSREDASFRLDEVTIREGEAYLSSVDPVMAHLVRAHGPCVLAPPGSTPFYELTASIIGQQLSGRAATTIEGRVTTLAGGALTPEAILALDEPDLRTAGLSGAKVRYIRELARRIVTGELELERIYEGSDEEVVRTLIALPGIGKWTCEMFLMFHLRRPDVFSPGDGALQRAVRQLYPGVDSVKQQEEFARRWSPYRSVASWYLWSYMGT